MLLDFLSRQNVSLETSKKQIFAKLSMGERFNKQILSEIVLKLLIVDYRRRLHYVCYSNNRQFLFFAFHARLS